MRQCADLGIGYVLERVLPGRSHHIGYGEPDPCRTPHPEQHEARLDRLYTPRYEGRQLVRGTGGRSTQGRR